MKFEPLFNNVLVKRSEAVEEQTSGGIYLPQTSQVKSNEATVVAVGPGRQTDHGFTRTVVKPGDKVLIPEYSGMVVKLSEGEFLLLREDELFGIFRPEDEEIRL